MTKTSINEAHSVSLCDTFRYLSSRDEDPQSVHASEKPMRYIEITNIVFIFFLHYSISSQWKCTLPFTTNCDDIHTLKIPQAGLCAPAVEFCAGGVACRAFFTSFTFVDVASPEQCNFLNEIHFRNNSISALSVKFCVRSCGPSLRIFCTCRAALSHRY